MCKILLLMPSITRNLLLLLALAFSSAFAGPLPARPGSNAPISHMSYLDNGRIRLGVDSDYGGAVTYLSKSGSTENVVNDDDPGREIQMSMYAGPVPFHPPGTQVQDLWKALGWNPIQCGDSYQHRTHSVIVRNDGKNIYVKCIPLIFPLNDVAADCTFETWIRLEGNTVHVACKMVNHRSDPTEYISYQQELPALYANGGYDRVVTYDGDKPYTNAPLTNLNCLNVVKLFLATENWAALLDKDGWGIGIWEPGQYSIRGYEAGTVGSGGSLDPQTAYLSPDPWETIGAKDVYTYHYALILGTVDDIRRYACQHPVKSVPPSYVFNKDRQHWAFWNAADAGQPVDGSFKLMMEQPDPQMWSPEGLWKADHAPVLYITAAYHAHETSSEIYWRRFDDPAFSESESKIFPIVSDGHYHTYAVNLSGSAGYYGSICDIRFDPEPTGFPGDYVLVRSISFQQPKFNLE